MGLLGPILPWIFKKILICLILTVLDLLCCMGFSLVAESKGYSLVAVLRLLIALLLGSIGSRACGLQ